MRLGHRRLSRKDLWVLAEDYCTSAGADVEYDNLADRARIDALYVNMGVFTAAEVRTSRFAWSNAKAPSKKARKHCNRRDRARWLREFREEARVAHDALVGGDRGVAMRVLTRLVLLEDAIMLCSPDVTLRTWAGHYDTEFLAHEGSRLLDESIQRETFKALTTIDKAMPIDIGHAFHKMLEEYYAAGMPDTATGEQLDVLCRLTGVVRNPASAADIAINEDGDLEFPEVTDEELRRKLRESILLRLQTQRGEWFADMRFRTTGNTIVRYPRSLAYMDSI